MQIEVRKDYLMYGVLALIVVVGIFAYSDVSETPVTEHVEYTYTPQSSPTDLDVGIQAPESSIKDPEKGSISKSTFEGKPLFIFFTTTWCIPCQIGGENLAQYDEEKGDDAFNVLIVFLDPRETDSQFIEWRDKFGRKDWYVAKGVDVERDYNMGRDYKVRFLDTKYLIDREGIIRWADELALEYKTIAPAMEPWI